MAALEEPLLLHPSQLLQFELIPSGVIFRLPRAFKTVYEKQIFPYAIKSLKFYICFKFYNFNLEYITFFFKRKTQTGWIFFVSIYELKCL